MIDQWWFHQSASGLLSAGWTEIWHQGLGVGLIIILLLLAYFSPFNKKYFLFAAGACALALLMYSVGHHDEAKVCEAKVKKIYLEAHPLLTRRNTAPNWKIAPSWDPSAPPRYQPLHCDGPFDTTCWGQY